MTSGKEPDIRNPQGQRLAQGLDLLRKQLTEIDALLSKPPFGETYQTWVLVTSSILKEFWGGDSDEYSWFDIRPVPMARRDPYMSDAQWEARLRPPYETTLSRRKTALDATLAKYETLVPMRGSSQQSVVSAFISHHGQKSSLACLEEFLRALGVNPVVVEKSASRGRELHDNVDEHRRECHFAVVLFTKDEVNSEGEWVPSGSVLAEAGELREQFGDRIIYLKEKGASLPPMASTLQYEPFTEDDMGPAFLKIVRELHAWGFLRVDLAPA